MTFYKPRLLIGLLVLVSLFAAACTGEPPIPSGPIVHSHDSAVRDTTDGGLNLKIVKFQWRYLRQTDQINVIGWAQNLSEESIQGCRLIVEVFDQHNAPLGSVQNYLNPAYIGPDRMARFEFFLDRGKWVKSIHMKYRFETRY